MIQFFSNMFIDDHAEAFYIKHKTGVWIRITFYGNEQLIVMAMPVLIGAFAKDFLIFFVAPGRVIKLMGRIKMLGSGQVHNTHSEAQSYGKPGVKGSLSFRGLKGYKVTWNRR